MALQNTDLFIVERAGVQYKMTADQLAEFVGAVNDFTAADLTARDALANLKVGDRVFVVDASADPTVDAGWAVYRVGSVGPNVFDKIQEQESLDLNVSGATNLSVIRDAVSVTVESDTGTNAIIPLADATNAGLASPAMFANAHPLATAGLTSAANPINITAGQVLTFGITQLTDLP